MHNIPHRRDLVELHLEEIPGEVARQRLRRARALEKVVHADRASDSLCTSMPVHRVDAGNNIAECDKVVGEIFALVEFHQERRTWDAVQDVDIKMGLPTYRH